MSLLKREELAHNYQMIARAAQQNGQSCDAPSQKSASQDNRLQEILGNYEAKTIRVRQQAINLEERDLVKVRMEEERTKNRRVEQRDHEEFVAKIAKLRKERLLLRNQNMLIDQDFQQFTYGQSLKAQTVSTEAKNSDFQKPEVIYQQFNNSHPQKILVQSSRTEKNYSDRDRPITFSLGSSQNFCLTDPVDVYDSSKNHSTKAKGYYAITYDDRSDLIEEFKRKKRKRTDKKVLKENKERKRGTCERNKFSLETGRKRKEKIKKESSFSSAKQLSIESQKIKSQKKGKGKRSSGKPKAATSIYSESAKSDFRSERVNKSQKKERMSSFGQDIYSTTEGGKSNSTKTDNKAKFYDSLFL